MRSVFIFNFNHSKIELINKLELKYGKPDNKKWVQFVNNDPIFYIELSNDFTEFEKSEMEFIKSNSENAYYIHIDISGRHKAYDELLTFIEYFMFDKKSFAQDDYSSHFWSKNDILSSKTINSHKFFKH